MSSSMSVFQKRIAALLQGDQVIWLVLGLLGIISILTVYSSAEVLANRNGVGTESFLVKHIMLLIASVVVMYIAHLIHYKRYARWSTIMLVLSVLMLLFTMFFGTELNGASRWIKIPFVGITFQTSDFAKISLILYVARTISLLQEKKGSLLELVLPVLLVCVLIAPSDLSSALVLFFTCILLMFIGR